jgi:6-phosphogluconolactonase (cycloisomerase 2 family)
MILRTHSQRSATIVLLLLAVDLLRRRRHRGRGTSLVGRLSRCRSAGAALSLYVPHLPVPRGWAEHRSGDRGHQPGSPWTIPEEALDIEADPTGSHLYVPVQSTTSLHIFSIDPGTGSLTEVLPAVTPSGSPAGVVVHPSGNFVYVPLYFSPSVHIYARNPTTGALTSLGLSPTTGGNPNARAVIHPSGDYLYVASQGGNQVKAFVINQATGLLTDNGSQTATNVRSLSLDPTGSYLYAGTGTTSLYAFAVTPGTGVLTPLGPPTYTAGGTTNGLDFHRTSTGYVVVTENGNGSVASYAFNGGNGALSYVGSYITGTTPWSVAFCDDFVYISHANSTHISGFTINPGTGTLAPTAEGMREMTERMDDLEAVGCN